MPRATCRCGQALPMPPAGLDHVHCPNCGARVRIVRKRPATSAEPGDPGASGDGFIRFSCPCGRRLKVNAVDPPKHGKCPDCDRVVPVPEVDWGYSSGIESPTEELSTADVEMLEAWTRSHLARGNGPKGDPGPSRAGEGARAEAGLRVCPRCGKPIHLNADSCRACGIPVPKR